MAENRVTQVGRVAIVEPTDVETRVTQLARVAFVDTQPPARVTQLALIVIREFTPDDPLPPATWQASMAG